MMHRRYDYGRYYRGRALLPPITRKINRPLHRSSNVPEQMYSLAGWKLKLMSVVTNGYRIVISSIPVCVTSHRHHVHVEFSGFDITRVDLFPLVGQPTNRTYLVGNTYAWCNIREERRQLVRRVVRRSALPRGAGAKKEIVYWSYSISTNVVHMPKSMMGYIK